MGLFLFTDGPALVCGWVNFPMLWPNTPVQMKLKLPGNISNLHNAVESHNPDHVDEVFSIMYLLH